VLHVHGSALEWAVDDAVLITDLLGVGRASLYRAIDTLEKSGAITKNGKSIIINDINALLNI
jgi:CRP-like cAMP-binding protein